MDVNQTRYQLVYGKNDWYGAVPSSPSAEPLFDWDDASATLGLHQDLFVFPPLTGQVPLAVENRRGAARDRYGNWYWIAPSSTEILFLGTNEFAAEHFWSSSDVTAACPLKGDFITAAPSLPAALVFSGLAVTHQHYLVAGVLEPKGVLVFDLYSGGPPSQLLWPAAVPFVPFDMSPSADGGVYILDRVNKAYWEMDRDLQVRGSGPATAPADVFQPAGGMALRQVLCAAAGGITAQDAVPLSGTSDPVAIESLNDGSVAILDNPPGAPESLVHRFQDGVEAGPPLVLDHALALYVPDHPTPQNPFPQAVRGYDLAFVAAGQAPGAQGVLYIVQEEGDQAFAFDLTAQSGGLKLAAQPRYLPMRKFQGKALVASGTSVYYDFQNTWAPLAEQPQPRYQQRAQLLLPLPRPGASPPDTQGVFDGKLPGCVWHRLCLEACIPAGASIGVESRAADLPQLVAAAQWQTEPNLYLRGDGPEIPYYQTQLQGATNRVGTWELLFQAARGRYLQLRLTLNGTGRNTPHLYALRAYYPRFSYLRQYLPAVYRDDAVSASFLDRFLANIEGFYTVLEGKIQDVQELFDPQTIPSEYLDWLASWMSIVLDTSWSDSTKRLVLSHAPQMFQQRGTPNGIVRAIRLMLDSCPDDSLFTEPACDSGGCPATAIFNVRLVERFLTRSAPGVVFGDPTDVAGPGSVASSSGWTPAQGPEPLNAQFRCFLQTQYTSIAALNQAWSSNYGSFDDVTLPPVQPAQSTAALDWSHFLRDALGFTYAPVSASDLGSYQGYLAQKYSTIGDLNTAYQLVQPNQFTSFSAVPLPTTMPPGGAMLQDWIEFVSVALPTQQNAHRFTILVPVSASDTPDAQQTKLAIAQRVAEIEKPAHTSYDVRLYWGMFRAGEARLGLDTLLGPGSRFTALVLGSGYLASSNLAEEVPLAARGRKRLGPRPPNSSCRQPIPQKRCV